MESPDQLTEADLTTMDARCRAASPAPWYSLVVGRDLEAGLNCIELGSCEVLEVLGGRLSDQDFIAHARNDLPRLIAEVKRLKGLLSAREAELTRLAMEVSCARSAQQLGVADPACAHVEHMHRERSGEAFASP